MYSSESCLEVSNLSCERGFRQLFDNLCFRLEAGEIAHITGLNGAGKTTLLRAIAGLFQPESGEITLDGDVIPEHHSGIAYLGHKIALRGSLTARENLEFAEYIHGKCSGLSIDESFNILNAIDYSDLPVSELFCRSKTTHRACQSNKDRCSAMAIGRTRHVTGQRRSPGSPATYRPTREEKRSHPVYQPSAIAPVHKLP